MHYRQKFETCPEQSQRIRSRTNCPADKEPTRASDGTNFPAQLVRDEIFRLRRGAALTLVEMVVAMAIMAIVFAAVLPELRVIRNSWDSKADAAEALQNGRVLMDHLYRNLSKAVRITAVSDWRETLGYIEFQDNDGSIARYDIGADSYVEFGPIGNPSELAGPVSQLQFTCFDACDLDTPTTDIDEIRSVKFKATLLNLSPLGQDRTFTGQAYLRTNAISFGESVTPGVAVWDRIEVEAIGRIDAISSQASVSTNSTSSNKIIVEDVGMIDADVFVGPGGDPERVIRLFGFGKIKGSTGILTQVVDMPVPTEPKMGDSVGDRTYEGLQTETISGNLYCDKFEIKNFAKVEIAGNVTILADKGFTIQDFGQLRLLEGATLTLYTKNNFEAKNAAQINVNTADPSRFMINHLGSSPIEVDGSSRLFATVLAPYGQLHIKDFAQFYGTFRGREVKVYDHGQLHTVSIITREGILP